jgi:MYXO-CTERM domain-containing protein
VGSTTGGTGPHITEVAPEPTAVTLAVLGVLGGGGYRLVRRRK